MTDRFTISEQELTPGEADAILAGLVAADPRSVGPRIYLPLTLTLRDADGRLVGGVIGATIWQWLSIDVLWVAEPLRGRGHGSRLVEAAETAARARGCGHAQLSTFAFQARAFYERHGYRVYGRLEGFPVGHEHLHMSKAL